MGHSERASIFDGNDPKTRVQDDVFRAVNGGWMETTEIPEDLPWIGSFVELVLQAEKHVREIIEDLVKTEETDAHPGGHAQRDGAEQTGGNANESGEAHKDAHKIGALFSSWMDVDALNAKGTAPLRADLAPVEGLGFVSMQWRERGTLVFPMGTKDLPLEQRRDVFESHGVFSPAAIDGTLSELRSYGDRTLRADVADKPREIAALVERFFHCG